MPKPNDKDPFCWDNLTPKEKELLTAFRNSTPEAQEKVVWSMGIV